jgi:hypothetical protein
LVHDSTRLQPLVTTFCGREEEEARKNACVAALNVDSIVRRGAIPAGRHLVTRLSFSLPFTHRKENRQSQLITYLTQARGTAGIAVFGQFTANLSDRTAYVTTDVISGLAGGTILGIQYAAVVVKDTTHAPAARSSIEDNTATALRMVNNGGTVTARIQYPVYPGGGTTFQTASSIYGTVGVIGPIGNADSLRLSLSAVGEVMTGIAIRDAAAKGGVLGEVVIGVRGGTGWSESELVPGSGHKWLPFTQLAVGVRQNGKLGLSLLYTLGRQQGHVPGGGAEVHRELLGTQVARGVRPS